jgi:hypothetical protein
MHMSVEQQTMRKRNSPFFVKDILGLSDESENESDQAMDSGDDQNRESSTEDSMENRKLILVISMCSILFRKLKITHLIKWHYLAIVFYCSQF